MMAAYLRTCAQKSGLQEFNVLKKIVRRVIFFWITNSTAVRISVTTDLNKTTIQFLQQLNIYLK